MRKNTVIPALGTEARLRRELRQHLANLGLQRTSTGELSPPKSEKTALREVHRHQRRDRLNGNARFIRENVGKLEGAVANGADVDVSKIHFELQRIEAGTREAVIFRLAALSWSVPVSNGFGRRLRYLVWDRHNGKLAGLIAIGDPVFNLSVRDKLIGWDAGQRADRLANVLDAYVLGALPPYSFLLGGKVIACLIRSRDIFDDFDAKYGGATGLISGTKKRSRLLLVTTTSSLGRSSLYNRLKLCGTHYFRSIGFTEGWGHFHISDRLFSELRRYLQLQGHPYVSGNRFGQGPNWRLRTIRQGLKVLGLSEATLHHGLKREVFMSELADNAMAILRSGRGRPDLSSLLRADDVARAGVERWMIGRAERRPEFRAWRAANISRHLCEVFSDGPNLAENSHAD